MLPALLTSHWSVPSRHAPEWKKSELDTDFVTVIAAVQAPSVDAWELDRRWAAQATGTSIYQQDIKGQPPSATLCGLGGCATKLLANPMVFAMQSLSTGILPHKWKVGKVVPVYKSATAFLTSSSRVHCTKHPTSYAACTYLSALVIRFKLFVHAPVLLYSQPSFARAASDWNGLPHRVAAITCPSRFHQELTQLMICHIRSPHLI
ncbi:uncharacterized protein LOC144114738 isoform X3 [Amblyomma americanum]